MLHSEFNDAVVEKARQRAAAKKKAHEEYEKLTQSKNYIRNRDRETDRAIDGVPSKAERVVVIGVWVMLWSLLLSFVGLFVAYGFDIRVNPWWWVLALIGSFAVYVVLKLLFGDMLINRRTRSQPPKGGWKPS